MRRKNLCQLNKFQIRVVTLVVDTLLWANRLGTKSLLVGLAVSFFIDLLNIFGSDDYFMTTTYGGLIIIVTGFRKLINATEKDLRKTIRQ